MPPVRDQARDCIRDDRGIAHVYGSSDADAVFGTEYAQAEDDFHRVEMNYLDAMGRRAEADGERAIYQDLRMKLFVNPDSMRALYAASPEWLKALMVAFADGLNYYLYTHPKVTPKVIRRFEPWMALTFTEGSIGGDIERVNLRDLQAFYGGGPQRQAMAGDGSAAPAEPSGSNGIAIAPSNTLGHRALLWINPHTSFYFRSELQMVSDSGLDAYGAVTWGQFFVYQGFNDRAGWTHTSSGVDAVDEFLETVVTRGGRTFYRHGREELPVTVRTITVPFKTGTGMAAKTFTACYTRHGPQRQQLCGGSRVRGQRPGPCRDGRRREQRSGLAALRRPGRAVQHGRPEGGVLLPLAAQGPHRAGVPSGSVSVRRVVSAALLIAAASAPAPLRAQERPRGPLARTLSPLFEGRAWRHATWGAMVVSLTRGDTLLSYRADRRFVPGSNAKLFTTAAALHYLGPDFRFLTVLFASGPVRGGTLYGDLVLYGTGDPTFGLDTADLAPFADSVVRAGIRRVRGDVVGDASFLGAELAGPGWSPDNLDQVFAAPPSALGAAENRIEITVEPGAGGGDPAVVTVDPPNDYLTVSSVVVTGRPHSRTRITARRGPSPRLLTLSGVISPARRAWTTDVVVQEPAVFAAGLLRSLLAARGVTVTGTTRSVTDDAPRRARLLLARARGESEAPLVGAIALRNSPSLGNLVAMINHRSHNLSAELVFRSIGRSVGGAGTFASGARAVADFLRDKVGIAPASVSVTDGSGLSLLDEATPRSLVQLLAYERRAPEAEVFWRSLPVAGRDLDRMEDTPAEGRLRAKTGTMKNASALAGYVLAANGEELAFSIMVNDAWRIERARRVQDEIGAKLARFSR